MLNGIELFKIAGASLQYTDARQGVIARNLANADTPKFRAADLPPFSELVRSDQIHLKASRENHIRADRISLSERATQIVEDPNGNGVSLEQEMLNAADTRRSHDQALAVFRSTLSIFRTAVGKS